MQLRNQVAVERKELPLLSSPDVQGPVADPCSSRQGGRCRPSLTFSSNTPRAQTDSGARTVQGVTKRITRGGGGDDSANSQCFSSSFCSFLLVYLFSGTHC